MVKEKSNENSITIFDLPEGGDEIKVTYAAQLYLELHLRKRFSSCHHQQGKSCLTPPQAFQQGKFSFDPELLERSGLCAPLEVDLTELSVEVRKMPHINVGDDHNMTLVHGICLLGNLDMLKLVVEEGASLKSRDIHDYTALHYCAMFDRVDMFNFILSTEPTLIKQESTPAKRLPIHIAAVSGSVGVMRVILECFPGMLYLPDRDGRTPLWLATYYRQGAVAEMLFNKSEFTYQETSEPELSFLLRLGTRINPLARKLLDRLVVKCPERNTNYYWLEDTALVNKAAVQANKISLDSGLLLASVDKENKASSMTRLLDHPVFFNNLLFKWNCCCRGLFFLNVVVKWVYIILWTIIYSLDSSHILVENQDSTLKVLLLVNLGIIFWILCYDYGRIISSVISVRRYKNHEDAVARSELRKLHRKMWLVKFSRKSTIEKDVRGEEPRYMRLRHILTLGLDGREISKFALAEHIVDILSLLILIYMLVLTFTNTNRVDKTKLVNSTTTSGSVNYTVDNIVVENQSHDYLVSVVLICQWFVGLSTFRVLDTFGYLLEVLSGIFTDIIRIGVFWVAIYIPLTAIFWETIYSWELEGLTSPLNSSSVAYNNTEATQNRLTMLLYTYYETFSKTHAVYDYDLGLNLTLEKGEAFKIPYMELWWYTLHFYWTVAGGIVLINMLISLMGITTNQAQEKARSISLYNTMIFVAEIESMIPGLTSRWIGDKVWGSGMEGAVKVMEFPNTEEDLEERDETDVWQSLEDLKGLVGAEERVDTG